MSLTLVLGRESHVAAHIMFGFFLAALLVAGVSFYDDMVSGSYRLKLAGQLVAVLLVLAAGVVLTSVQTPWGVARLGWLGYPLSFLWLVGLTNAYNFMDGLNGLAGGVGLVVCLFFGLTCAITGSHFVYMACLCLGAGVLGFLPFNVPRARLFMGDVGSAFLGFCFAALAVIASAYDQSHTSFLVMVLLLFNIIWDTFFTFLRRLAAGERVLEAHRTHLYQLLNRMGASHLRVSGLHVLVATAQGMGALAMIHLPGESRLTVFVPFIIWQVLYTVAILRAAKGRNLLAPQAARSASPRKRGGAP